MIYFPKAGSISMVTIHVGDRQRSEPFKARYMGQGVWRIEVEGDATVEPSAHDIHPDHQPEWADLDLMDA